MTHSVLVAYASRHGSTRAIADRIAATLRECSVDATVLPIDQVRDVDGYDGYVIGSAVYAMRWLGEARSFVRSHRATLRRHPVWLFSSGPLSTDAKDAEGAAPRDAASLVTEVGARDHVIFGGAYDREAPPIGLMERFMSVMPAARDALPNGDFRDWHAIDTWATGVAGELELALVKS
jgi:menaquinone-dependent protoporphyrinogen oxidase